MFGLLVILSSRLDHCMERRPSDMLWLCKSAMVDCDFNNIFLVLPCRETESLNPRQHQSATTALPMIPPKESTHLFFIYQVPYLIQLLAIKLPVILLAA